MVHTSAFNRISQLEASKGGKNPNATLPSGGKRKSEVLKEAGISTQDAGLAKLAASLKQQITKDLDQYFPALGSTRVKH